MGCSRVLCLQETEWAERSRSVFEEMLKKEWAEKLGDITATVKAAGLCKRDLPSLNQVKLFLKKQCGASKEVLETVTEENVVDKFTHITVMSMEIKTII